MVLVTFRHALLDVGCLIGLTSKTSAKVVPSLFIVGAKRLVREIVNALKWE